MSKWISVKDRLPESPGAFVCWMNKEYYRAAYFFDRIFYSRGNNITDDVLLWLRLPEVPETKKIPFDLERAKRGDEVIDREGRPVRIICFDFKDRLYPLVVENLGDEEGLEYYPHTCTNDGIYLLGSECEEDLFMKYPLPKQPEKMDV